MSALLSYILISNKIFVVVLGDDSSLGAPPSYYSVTSSTSEDNIDREGRGK